MVQTRRLDELINVTRPLAYSEGYSLTEGWNNNVLANIFNLAQNKLYCALTKIENDAYVQTVSLDVAANTQAYDIPIDVSFALRLVDVRYIFGTTPYQYVELVNVPLQDRFPFPGNVPGNYCIRNGQIILSPVPTQTKAGALEINYQKRMRDLDIRRGIVASRTTGSPVTITVSYTTTSQKDANMRQNGESVLDLVDYICIVDYKGSPIVNGIPISSYNRTTQVITANKDYTFPAAELAALDALIAAGQSPFIVTGQYASTNSEMHAWCEGAMIEFAVFRLLQLQSNAGSMDDQNRAVEDFIARLITQHRRIRPSNYRVDMLRGNRSTFYPTFGRW